MTILSTYGPIVGGVGGGSGGGGLILRDPADEFTGNNLSTCRTARNTYFSNTSNAEDLAEFQANGSLAIILNPTNSVDNVFETYDRRGRGCLRCYVAWLDRTDTVQGNEGDEGPQGIWYARIFMNAATAPTTEPTGGSIAVDRTITPPTNWVIAEDITAPATGEESYESIAEIDPASDTFPLVPTWSVPFEVGGVGGAAAAASAAASAVAAAGSATAAATSATGASGSATGATGSATAAAASAAAAAGSAGQVTSYSGPVAILENVAFESNNLAFTVTDWRAYDFLQLVVRDSNATDQIDRPSPLIRTAGLDTHGESRGPFNNNDEIRVERTDGSDVLTINITGWSGHPTTADVITIYGVRSGVEAGGPGGSTATNLSVGSRDADSLEIESDTGTNAEVPAASASLAGLQSAADKTKLDAIAASATAVTIQQVLDQVKVTSDLTIDRTTDGEITIGLAGTGDHTRRSAISTDTTLDQAEYDAGTTSDTEVITIPTWTTGTRYIYLGVPEDEDDITDIEQNGVSVFGAWEAVTGVFAAHNWWRTTDAQDAFSSGVTYTIVQ